jgi:hypothetical protein
MLNAHLEHLFGAHPEVPFALLLLILGANLGWYQFYLHLDNLPSGITKTRPVLFGCLFLFFVVGWNGLFLFMTMESLKGFPNI